MKPDALDYFLLTLGTLFRLRRIYPPGTGQVGQAARQAAQRLADWGGPVRITLMGADAIVGDRRLDVLPVPCQPLFQTLSQSGCESVLIEADAGEADLAAWVEHVASKQRAPYRGLKVVAGYVNMEKRSPSPPALARAVTGYLGFLSQAQEALTDMEAKKPGGLDRGREIVCAIASRMAVGRELFEPIHEIKDFDEYTFTHALNVCVLASALARALDLSHDTVNAISLAALCHDLGKRQVPKEIVGKRGPLTAEERALMEKHPANGARLLIETPGVASEAPLLPVVAYQHHMAADRSGYPRLPSALAPHRLHFASLLIAVADVYDALRTVRPYRPAMTLSKASTILLRDALSGKLHREYAAVFLHLLKVLVPGRPVVLSDGTRGVILEARPGRVLTPLVEDGEGRVRDLTDPSGPWVWEIEEEAEAFSQ